MTSLRTIAIAAAVATAHPGMAATMLFGFTGTVGFISDPTKIFGTAAIGDAYSLVYRADFARGRYSNFAGGSGGASDLFGGTQLAPWPAAPTIQLSPVSATLRIDGHRIDFAGLRYGEAEYVIFGAMLGAHSSAFFTARDVVPGTISPFDAISTDLGTDDVHVFDRLLTTPVKLTIGGAVGGRTSFGYGVADALGREPLVSGDLRPETFTASAVPEPEAWSLMFAGFAMIGCAGGMKKARVGDDAGLVRFLPRKPV